MVFGWCSKPLQVGLLGFSVLSQGVLFRLTVPCSCLGVCAMGWGLWLGLLTCPVMPISCCWVFWLWSPDLPL
jgi:hypothetical protein